MLAVDPVAEAEGAVNMVEGVIADVEGAVTIGEQIATFIEDATFFIEIIGFILILAKCFLQCIFLIWAILQWIGYFVVWLVYYWPPNLFDPQAGDSSIAAGFLPWLIRYIIVIAYKIMHFPKCFLWYFIDTATWILYLPFKFVFWLVDLLLNAGMVDGEHAAWRFMDEVDYFVHGKPNSNYFMYQYAANPPIDMDEDGNDKESMNLGFHIIHFPDSVMYECYSINPFGLANLPSFDMQALIDFIQCLTMPF